MVSSRSVLRSSSLSAWPRSGFSLVEVMVVMGVVVVLAALLFPAVSSIQDRGKQAECLSHLRQVGAVILQYSVDNDNRVLPAVSGKTHNMDDDAWYEVLDSSGLLAANPFNSANAGASLWGGRAKGIMTCPSRKGPARPYWTAGRHDLHYAMNQHPGFLNRVNTLTGPWPTLAAIAKPGRTFMLAEASSFITDHAGEILVYPHTREGEGMNLFFFDGHSEYFKGKLPALPGSTHLSVPYDLVSAEDSFPWF